MKILIVGGNAAGPSAAAKAKRVNPNAQVIMFEAGDHISTGTCELPYILSGEIDDYKKIIFFDPESFFNEKGVRVYIRHQVESIDRVNRKISVKNLNDETVVDYDYDKLILSTGSSVNRLPFLNREFENSFNLKSVSDFLKIRDYLKTGGMRKAVIVGAGYIGLETSEALNELGLENVAQDIHK